MDAPRVWRVTKIFRNLNYRRIMPAERIRRAAPAINPQVPRPPAALRPRQLPRHRPAADSNHCPPVTMVERPATVVTRITSDRRIPPITPAARMQRASRAINPQARRRRQPLHLQLNQRQAPGQLSSPPKRQPRAVESSHCPRVTPGARRVTYVTRPALAAPPRTPPIMLGVSTQCACCATNSQSASIFKPLAQSRGVLICPSRAQIRATKLARRFDRILTLSIYN
jgi:hypothetical protein